MRRDGQRRLGAVVNRRHPRDTEIRHQRGPAGTRTFGTGAAAREAPHFGLGEGGGRNAADRADRIEGGLAAGGMATTAVGHERHGDPVVGCYTRVAAPRLAAVGGCCTRVVAGTITIVVGCCTRVMVIHHVVGCCARMAGCCPQAFTLFDAVLECVSFPLLMR